METLRRTPPARWAAVAICALLGWLARDGWVPFLSGVDLGVHELGHLITFWASSVVVAAAGSVLQVAAPLALAGYFDRVRGERHVAAVLLTWAGTSALAAAVYIADAPFEELALFGGGLHDWAFLLGPEQCDCLDRAAGLASFVRVIGWSLVTAGPVLALWPQPTPLVVPTGAVLSADWGGVDRGVSSDGPVLASSAGQDRPSPPRPS